MADNLMDNPQERAEAAQEPDTSSQATFNQREHQPPKDHGRAGDEERAPGRIANQTAVRPQDALRSEPDRGYGSQHRGDEYQDVEVDQKDEDAA